MVIEELQSCRVEIIFLNHDFGKGPEDNLLLQMQGMIAEYERAKILERSRRGKLHAARKGSVNVLGGAPYGYKYVSCFEGHGEASYEIILEEAQVVREIFEWVGRDGYSMGKVKIPRELVAEALNRAPKTINYSDRNPNNDLVLNKERPYFCAMGGIRSSTIGRQGSAGIPPPRIWPARR
ncbi:hypothetical protein ES705_48753 [subsurface metagenome]